jgi:hypothetical protein
MKNSRASSGGTTAVTAVLSWSLYCGTLHLFLECTEALQLIVAAVLRNDDMSVRSLTKRLDLMQFLSKEGRNINGNLSSSRVHVAVRFRRV